MPLLDGSGWLGMSYSHKNPSQGQDGEQEMFCLWLNLLSLGYSLRSQAEEKLSWAARAELICRAEPGTVCFPLCTQAQICSAGSQDQNSLHFPEARTSLPVLALIIAQFERDLCHDLGVSGTFGCERMAYLLIATMGS